MPHTVNGTGHTGPRVRVRVGRESGYSDFCEGHGPKNDCIQSSGAGYYVVPAGDIALVPGQTYHVSITTNPLQGFFAPGGQVWQAEAAFEWLLGAAFGP